MNLLDLPLEILEIIIRSLLPSLTLNGDSDESWEFVQTRLVCHVFDNLCCRTLAQSFEFDPHVTWNIHREWPIYSTIWLLKVKLLHFYNSGRFQEANQPERWVMACKAAIRLREFLSQNIDELDTASTSIAETMDTVASVLVFDDSLHSLRRGSMPPGAPTVVRSLDLLPLLAVEGNVKGMERLLSDTGVDVNDRSALFGGALYMAAVVDEAEAVTWLIDRGANIDQLGGRWHTPLRASVAYFDTTDSLSILLNAGAKLNIQDEGGTTVLMTAAAAGHEPAVAILLDQDLLHVDLLDGEDESVVHHLCRVPAPSSLRKLLGKYPTININHEGSQGAPLHVAINRPHYDFGEAEDETVKILLSYGPDLKVSAPGTGEWPLQWARETRNDALEADDEVPAAVTRVIEYYIEKGWEREEGE